MRKKLFFFGGIFLCLVIGCWGYYLYQKPRAGVQNTKSDYTIQANDLYSAFASDEMKANQQFINKVIEVEGLIQHIDSIQGTLTILLASDETSAGINCALIDTKKQLPSVGQRIRIKGRCTGYLMDVNLTDAIIVNQ